MNNYQEYIEITFNYWTALNTAISYGYSDESTVLLLEGIASVIQNPIFSWIMDFLMTYESEDDLDLDDISLTDSEDETNENEKKQKKETNENKKEKKEEKEEDEEKKKEKEEQKQLNEKCIQLYKRYKTMCIQTCLSLTSLTERMTKRRIVKRKLSTYPILNGILSILYLLQSILPKVYDILLTEINNVLNTIPIIPVMNPTQFSMISFMLKIFTNGSPSLPIRNNINATTIATM